jgi:hypothetical protein
MCVVVAIGMGSLIAACGGSSSPSSTSSLSAGVSKQTAVGDAYKFSQCMRQHGVSNFPDPQVSANKIAITINPSISGSPAFGSAQKTCQKLMPGGGPSSGPGSDDGGPARLADELSFARCMRKHGVSRFPDPTGQGRLTIQMVVAAGVDVHAPVTLTAITDCLPAAHGLLTPASVRQAVNSVPTG